MSHQHHIKMNELLEKDAQAGLTVTVTGNTKGRHTEQRSTGIVVGKGSSNWFDSPLIS